MAYTLAADNNTPPTSQLIRGQAIAGSSGMVAVTGFTCVYLGLSTSRYRIGRYNTGGTTPTARTAEKTNSRSPAQGSTTNLEYVTDPTAIGGFILLIGQGNNSIAACNFRGWRAPARYPLLVEPSATIAISYSSSTAAGSDAVFFEEDDVRYEAPAGRRGRRPGWGFYADGSTIMPGRILSAFVPTGFPAAPYIQPQDWPPLVAARASLLLDADGAVSETPTPGGALAGGFGPVAQVAGATGGATAGGNAATARIAVTQGGASAAGIAPTVRVAAPQGGATAGGFGATVRITFTIGGAVAAGFAPSESGTSSDTPAPGGALAGGFAPSARIAAAIGGATAGGFTGTARVTLTIGGATAGGYAPIEPGPAVPLPPFSSRQAGVTSQSAGGRTGSANRQGDLTTVVRGRMGRA